MRKIKQMLIRIFKIGMVVFALWGLYITGYNTGKVGTKEWEIYARVTDSMPAKIDKLKNNLIDRLVKCESAGYTESDAPIILDSNAKMSFGVLQFQKKTVIHYYKVLYNRQISAKEAVLIALDEAKSRELAKKIIFETKSGTVDWLNCSRKNNLQAETDLIKKLEA